MITSEHLLGSEVREVASALCHKCGGVHAVPLSVPRQLLRCARPVILEYILQEVALWKKQKSKK